MALICQESHSEDSMSITVREKNSRTVTPVKEDVTQQTFVKQVLEENGIEVSPCDAKNLEALNTIKGQADDRKV